MNTEWEDAWDMVQALRQELPNHHSPAETRTITVIVLGDQVRGVEGLPEGWEWEIRDYDICAICGGTNPRCPQCSERLANALALASVLEGV